MYTYGYLFYIPISLLLTIIVVINGRLRKRSVFYYFYSAIFCIYINFLIKYAFFPIFIYGSKHFTHLSSFVNFDISKLFSYTPYQVIGNIALTFPLGILLAFISNTNIYMRTFCTIIIAISIEFVQLLLLISLHLIDFVFDINDIILNVLGGVLGNIFFYLFCKIYIRLNYDSKETSPFINYFRRICFNCANKKASFYE